MPRKINPLVAWCVCALCLLLSASALSRERTFAFRLSDGTSVTLEWATNQLVIETTTDTAIHELHKVASRHIPATAMRLRSAAPGGRLFRVDLATSSPPAAWHKRAAALTAEPGVRGAYPAFIEPAGGHWSALTGEINVRLKSGVSLEEALAKLAPRRVRLLERYAHDPRVVRLAIDKPSPFDALELSNQFVESGVAEWAEPDFLVEIRRAYTPNDPSYNLQWHLNNTAQIGGAFDADIDAAEAWDITRGDPAITIAILDDGMDIDHSDLRANIYRNTREVAGNGVDDDLNGYVDDVNGWDFFVFDNNPRADDTGDFHSTSVAGMAAARGDNSAGVSSPAPQCAILPCRIMGGSGSVQISRVVQAINYAAAYAQILSMSWTTTANSSLQSAFQAAATSGRGGLGCVLFAASGNESRADVIGFPSSLSFVMAIGSSTKFDQRASYSNYASGYGVFCLAPSGDGVYTTKANGLYGWFAGTSASSPEAAGVAALVLSLAPGLTRVQIEGVLRNSCDKVDTAIAAYDASGYSRSHGYGRINAYRAVGSVATDLAAQYVDFSPEIVARGGQIYFSGSVKNMSTVNSPACWVEFWLSNSPDFRSLNYLACDSVLIPELAPGAEFRLETVSRTLGANVPDGLYRLGVYVDRVQALPEVNRNNNFVWQPNRLMRVGAGSTNVDLTVEAFDFSPTQSDAGSPIQLSGYVVNRGSQMSHSVWVEFWASENSAGTPLLRLVCNSLYLGPLGPGEWFNLATLEHTVYPDMPNGRYRVSAVVDRPTEQVDIARQNNTVLQSTKWLTIGRQSGARSWTLYK